jgi:hypothetical protein
MGRSGMVFSIIAFAAGAVMYWAVTAHGHGFRLSTVGVILMIAGAVGFAASAIVFLVSRRDPTTVAHSFDQQTVDSQGRATAVHEEVR